MNSINNSIFSLFNGIHTPLSGFDYIMRYYNKVALIFVSDGHALLFELWALWKPTSLDTPTAHYCWTQCFWVHVFYSSTEVNTKGYMFIINIHLHHEYEFIQKLSCGYERKEVFAAALSHELIMFKVNQQNLAFQCRALLIFNKLIAVSVLTSLCWIFKHTFFVSVNYLIISVYMCIFFCSGLKYEYSHE